MASEGWDIAEDDDFHAGTSDGNIHATEVTQESYLAFIIRTHHREDDDITLLSLETINGIHADLTTERLEELSFHQQPTEILYLGAIGRDDTYIDTLVQ